MIKVICQIPCEGKHSPYSAVELKTWQPTYLGVERTHRQGASEKLFLVPPLAAANHASQRVYE